jgi:outer membrane protein assembly factor BamB
MKRLPFPALGIRPRLLACAVSLLTASAAASDWPQYTGPSGNFTQPPVTVPLVDDAAKARLLWESEENDLPAAKLYLQNRLPRPSGGMQSLVVADGRVIFAFMMPSGEDLAGEPIGKGGCPLDRKLSSDDTILAVDARSGKTLWKRVFLGKGVYIPPTKRGGFGVTPVAWQGMVFWLGPAGWLYAVDAATGADRWQVEVQPLRQQRLAEIDRAKAGGRRNFPDMLSSLVVADGVLVVPLFTRSAKGASEDLAGYDPVTGNRLWQLDGVLCPHTTPATWRHDGREYLLTGMHEPQVRLIDPRTGTVLWSLNEGLAPQWEQLAPWGEQVLLPIPATSREDKTFKRYAAFHLTPAGARRLWDLPDREPFLIGQDGDGRSVRRITPSGERFYLNSNSRDGLVIEMASDDGRELRRISGLKCVWANITTDLGNRLLYTGDAEHYHTGFPDFCLIATDGKDLTLLGRQWQPFRSDEGATAYEIPHAYHLDEGRLYLRTSMGVLRCYDFTVKP